MIRFTIHGEAASKGNSRRLVTQPGADPRTAQACERPRLIKSAKALAFESAALRQIPPRCRVRLDVPLRVTLFMFYASERPDLDESLVLDCLQDRYATLKVNGVCRRVLVQRGVFVNDRLVREKHVFHRIDRLDPRVEVVVEPLDDTAGDPS